MTKVFISHSDSDSEFALQLAMLLTKLGFEVWLPLAQIPGELPEIQNGLDECEAMIVVVSLPSMASLRVTREWQYYFAEEKAVIPFLWRPAIVPTLLQRSQPIN